MRYNRPKLSLAQRIEILREMLGFEGWRRWPLKVSILNEEVAKIWVKVGNKEGTREVSWSIIGKDVLEDEIGDDGATEQERRRDLNLKKLMTIDINDCILLTLLWLTGAHFLASHLEKSYSLLPPSQSLSTFICEICEKPLPTSHIEIALCPHEACVSLYHLTCLASHLETTQSILPVKGPCPKCDKEILWGDVIRGVFGRSARMDSAEIEDEDPSSSEIDEDEDEDEEVPETRRKKRGSDLVRLTGKSEEPQKSKVTKPKKGKRQTKKETVVIPASDGDDSEGIIRPTTPPQPKRRGRPKKKIPEPKVVNKNANSMEIVPDSAGEERDVWIISSDNE